jgi:hypothetical protein
MTLIKRAGGRIAWRFAWPPLAVLALAVALAQIPIPAWTVSPDDAPALARAFRTLTGTTIDPRHVCGRTVPGFADAIALGGFAYDRGCMLEGVIVAQRPLDLSRATVAALARAGWASAGPAERARLALAWTRGALLAWRTTLDEATADFALADAPDFAPPSATPLPDGGVRVELWVQEPGGMLPQADYSRLAVAFGADGSAAVPARIAGFDTGPRPRR